MSIKRLNYLAIPKEVRRKRAQETRFQLQGVMSSPGATEDQKEYATKQLGVVDKWLTGELPTEVAGKLDYQSISAKIDEAKKAK